LANGTLNTTPASQSQTTYGSRGANSIVSTGGIVWASDKTYNGGQGVLRAYDATNLSNELWNSNMNGGRDAAGTGAGFAVPLVADGKVIWADTHAINIYGLLN
jgi:hypothetical protein